MTADEVPAALEPFAEQLEAQMSFLELRFSIAQARPTGAVALSLAGAVLKRGPLVLGPVDLTMQYAPGDYGVVQAARFAKVYRLAD